MGPAGAAASSRRLGNTAYGRTAPASTTGLPGTVHRDLTLRTGVSTSITRFVLAVLSREFADSEPHKRGWGQLSTQLPWKPLGTRTGRWTSATLSSVWASSRTRSLVSV